MEIRKGFATFTTTLSLYLGTLTATAPSLFTLGISSRLERVFYYQVPQESSLTLC
ncbi:hypothetical protein ATN83_3972 [Raoultella ornithinolytica]|nr:hypothetical protein ATN83_3972 [Raoultella ornithinolytica]